MYLLLDEERGLNRDTLQSRIAFGARLNIQSLDDTDRANVRELLETYRAELANGSQYDEADRIAALAETIDDRFVKVSPVSRQVEQAVSTE